MSRRKILLVDDEPQNLQVLRHILKDDYILIFAKSGPEALTAAIEQHPDLVLLDVMMPEMDGYEVCRRLKADRRCNHIPVLFVTALNGEDDEAKGFQLGAVDYLVKPVHPSVVRVRIATHLALSDQQRTFRQQIIAQHEELLKTRHHALRMLGRAAEFKDNETGLHVVRMSLICQRIALAFGWNEEGCDLILNAAPMHDIGKIGTPDHILQKPGKLDPEEWKIMQRHTEIGARIIGESAHGSELFEMARVIALTHHEKWDGSGYPRGLSKDDIPIVGRIAAIADVFDALTSKRPYKEAWPIDQAVSYVTDEAGRHFDPTLVPLFLDILPAVLEVRDEWPEKE